MKDYYSILGVAHTVSQEVLDAVYKSFVKNHIESGVDIGEIEEAYNVLSNPTERLEYDKYIQHNSLSEEDDIIEFKYGKDENQSNKSKKTIGIFLLITILSVVLIMLISTVFDSSKSGDNIIADNNDYNHIENEPTEYYDENVENEESEDILVSKKYDIEDGTRFYEGVAFIKCKNGEVFAIDTKGDKLCTIEGCSDLKQISKFSNNVFAFNNCIYGRNGELIASPDMNNYDELYSWDIYTSNINGFFIAKKYVQSYEGDHTLWGILNNKGKWEVSLSNEDSWEYEENPYLKYSYYWRNEYIDSKTNCIKGKYEDDFQEYGYRIDDKIFDYNDNLLIDLSEYNPSFVRYSNGIFSFVSNNGTGADYMFLINQKGEFVIDPIRLGSLGYILSQDSNGILFHNDEKYEFCDYEGNIRNFGDYIVEDFNDGLALAYKSGHLGIENDFCYINYKGEIIIE